MPQVIPAIVAQLGAGAGLIPALSVGASTLSPLAIPLGLGAASVGTSLLQGAEQRKGQKKAMEQWQQTAYPSAEAVKAAAIQNRGQLAQGRLGAYQNLYTNLAARGFGAGSGLIGQGAQDIERSYLQTLGQQGTELTKFAQTPMWGPPTTAYPTTTTFGAGLETAGSIMDKAMGYYQTKKLYEDMMGKFFKNMPQNMYGYKYGS